MFFSPLDFYLHAHKNCIALLLLQTWHIISWVIGYGCLCFNLRNSCVEGLPMYWTKFVWTKDDYSFSKNDPLKLLTKIHWKILNMDQTSYHVRTKRLLMLKCNMVCVKRGMILNTCLEQRSLDHLRSYGPKFEHAVNEPILDSFCVKQVFKKTNFYTNVFELKSKYIWQFGILWDLS